MKVVTVGGAMVDSIAIVDDDRVERMSMSNADASFLLIESGRKVEAREISQHCGGGAVNTAVAMARLGFDVATIVKLGADARAEMILRRLSDESVSTRWVMRASGAATGAAVMIAAHDRDVAIFTYRGANTLLTPDDLKPDSLAADLVYIAGLSNEAADCFPRLVELAKAGGAQIATNPGVRQLTRRTGPFFDALGDIDLLSINRAEAQAIVPRLADLFGEGGGPLGAKGAGGAPALAERGLSSGGYEMSLRKFFQSLKALGVGAVLVTDGGRGAYASDGAHVFFHPAAAAKVAGTAGAGDAFASTFSAWLCNSKDVQRSLAAASENAASVIGYVDTQSGLLTRAVIEERLAAGPAAAAQSWPLDD